MLSMRAGDRLLKYDEINLWSPGVGVYGRTMFASPDTVYVPEVGIEAYNTYRGSNLQPGAATTGAFIGALIDAIIIIASVTSH